MARPELPIELLKHPRKKRKSTTVPTQRVGPIPSAKEIKKWKPLVDACTIAIATNKPLHLQPIKNKVRLKFWKSAPKGFPKSRIVDEIDGMVVCEYNAEILLLWMYERHLAPYTPNEIYTMRQAYLTSLSNSVNNYVAVPDEREYSYDL